MWHTINRIIVIVKQQLHAIAIVPTIPQPYDINNMFILRFIALKHANIVIVTKFYPLFTIFVLIRLF